ncbi:TRAP transporter substrate-binding protein [Planomicrobium okeanokoites]|uniref:TRAP transporter substrate-binding protein n=1 Tax=Planomicrobium okeanokoites TaxID=244 RepID=A0ABV7KRV9_PLAOK|nr:TRAP transporter substrate-binding protein [Planomicrobium okeanokoites]
MRIPKFLLMLTLIAALILAGCGGGDDAANETASSGGDSAEAVTIKLAHSSAPDSARDLGAQKFKEVVEAETDGQVTVEIYPASQLGNPTEIVQGVQMGNIEMAISPTAFMGGFEPLITLLDIPFLFPNDKDALMELQDSEAMANLLSKTDDIGIETLGIWHTGYKQFTGPVALDDPAAFNGLKFRSMPSPVLFEQFNILGASPTDLPFADTYNALQTGTIDGQENPLDTTYDMKLHEVQEVVTMTDHGVLDQLIIMNKDFFDGLDPAYQEAIQKGFDEGRTVTVDATYENIEEVKQIMEDEGIEFVEITPEQREAFIAETQSVRDFYIAEFGEEGETLLTDIEAAIEQ